MNAIYLLAWIPESLLNEKGKEEWEKFVRMEERTGLDDEDDGLSLLRLILMTLISFLRIHRCCSD